MTVCLRFRFIAHREQKTPDNQRGIYVLKYVSGARIKTYWVGSYLDDGIEIFYSRDSKRWVVQRGGYNDLVNWLDHSFNHCREMHDSQRINRSFPE